MIYTSLHHKKKKKGQGDLQAWSLKELLQISIWQIVLYRDNLKVTGCSGEQAWTGPQHCWFRSVLNCCGATSNKVHFKSEFLLLRSYYRAFTSPQAFITNWI